jgi:galactokinase
VAGDNLFEFSLKDFLDFFTKKGITIGLYDVGKKNLELMKQYAEVKINKNQQVVSFREKPKQPKTTLASICIYAFPRNKLRLVKQYLKEGLERDQPGRYIQWLYKKEPVFGFITKKPWYDIGSLEQYQKANLEKIKGIFCLRFGRGPVRIFSAPGRVNIIGEHTDYNLGYVLPANINQRIYLGARKRKDNLVNLYSLNYPQSTFSINLNQKITYRKEDGWANYVKGVFKILRDAGHKLGGVDLLFSSHIPSGSGLSSSAALEVVSIFALNALFKLGISKKNMVSFCQQVEDKFLKIHSGIMDQFVITFGQKDKAVFLDCQNYKFELVPFEFKEVNIVITNTKVKRELVFSAYNERVQQCQQGVKILKRYFKKIRSLRDLSLAQFGQYQEYLPPLIKKRCQHVIEENERVKKVVRALKAGNLVEVGELLNSSHRSLKELYEVSSPELDCLVREARKVKGVLGSRLTGAGFGGCTISLVKKEALEEFMERLTRKYQQSFSKTPDFYICQIAPGVKREV